MGGYQLSPQPPTWTARVAIFVHTYPVTCPTWEALPAATLPPLFVNITLSYNE